MAYPALSEEARQLFDCMKDVWWRLDNLYYIQDEDGKEVLFQLRPIQRLFLQVAWYRNVILKARQLGFTTAIDIFILDRAVFNANTNCGIIAHTKDDVVEIFANKVKYAYERLPSDIRSVVTAATDKANHLKFSNGSSVRVAVSMRSGTLQILHISEYGKLWARYPEKAKEVKTGSLPTVHQNGMIFIESTAEGIGGHFHELSMQSKRLFDEGVELNRLDYKFHFFPWWGDSKYELPCPDEYVFSREHVKYSEGLDKYTGKVLSRNKRYWYVVTESTYGTEMKQEYPSTPEEAFLFSGRKAFDANSLNAAEEMCFPPMFTGEISTVNGELREIDGGELHIWEMPDPNEKYSIGADVAEGIEVGEEDKDLDYSSADVLDGFGQQVAQWHGRIGTDLYGQILDQLGRLYNNAYLGVERNNHGHAVLNELKRLNYPNVHIQEMIDDKRNKKTRKPGFHTNVATKPFIIGNLSNAFRDEESGIRSKQTIKECHTYVVDGKGRYGAQDSCHDDRVMSYAIAKEMVRVMPRTVDQSHQVQRSNRDWRAA